MIIAAVLRRTQPLSIYTPRLLDTSTTVAMFFGELETAPIARGGREVSERSEGRRVAFDPKRADVSQIYGPQTPARTSPESAK